MSQLKARLAITLVRTAGHLPFQLLRRIGSGLGTVAYYLNTRMAKVTQKNVSICFPHLNDLEKKRLVRKSLQETGKTVTETCFIWQRDVQHNQRLITGSEGEDVVHRALAQGKGLLVLAPHLGNWEALGCNLSRFAETTNLYQPPKLKGFDHIIRAGRTRSGCHLVPTNSKGIASLLQQLKRNGICGILPDQAPKVHSSGGFANFFGEPALTMTLVHKLIQRTQCRAVFAYAKRTPKGFTLIFREAPEALFSEDQHESLQALNRGIEKLVREAPEQYQWDYKRFKVVSPQRPVHHYS